MFDYGSVYYFLVCPDNQYKDKIGNEKCTACPENSKATSDEPRVQCSCKDKFYRFLEGNHTQPCYGRCCVGGFIIESVKCH